MSVMGNNGATFLHVHLTYYANSNTCIEPQLSNPWLSGISIVRSRLEVHECRDFSVAPVVMK